MELMIKILLLVCLCCSRLQFISFVTAQMIIQPPESTTAALNTNATFSCRGIGRVLWHINGSEVKHDSQVTFFGNAQIFVPLPNNSFSKLTVTATRMNNASLVIICVVDASSNLGDSVRSDPVQLLVYAEPNPPFDLNITVDGLSLVAAWNEPFLLEGELLFYVIYITNKASGEQDEVKTNTTTYVLSEPFGERDCAEYMFTIFSNNSYSMSTTSISGYNSIPTVPIVIRRSDVWIEVSLIEEIRIIISFNAGDPCPAYPVIIYTLNIFEDSGSFTATITHTGNTSVDINGNRLGLQRDQVYQLTIEATNIVGSTSSETVHLYTTGLQSSFAVLELDGSITVTCTFATGATSTGCQVTILVDDLQVFSTIITRSISDTQVSMTLDMIHNYRSTLLIHTAEVLSGGNVNHNVNFSQTIHYTLIATSIVIPGFTKLSTSTTPASLQVPSEYIIIVAALCAIWVLMVITTIVISAVFLHNARRKTNRHDSSNSVRPRANVNTAIEMKENEVYGMLCRDDGIETSPNGVYGIHTERANRSVSPSYPAYEYIETIPNVLQLHETACDGIETTPS